ncbi:MAG: hypothetical protein RLP97_15150, partial [Coleofasciculus chthonoplastes F2-STO-03]
TKLIIKSEGFESQESSENAQVRSMIRESGLVNKIFTLDALHCSQQTINLEMTNRQEIQIFCSYKLSKELDLKIFLNREN